MNGPELKKILTGKGYLLKDVAAKLGLTQPNFSQIVKAQDVKSGTLENICDALGVKMDFFYEGTRFAPEVVAQPSQTVVKQSEDVTDKDKEILLLKGQLMAMKEAYNSLADRMSNTSANSLRQVVNE